MGLFSKIMDKIFHPSHAEAPTGGPSGTPAAQPVNVTPTPTPAPTPTTQPAAQPVDVEAVLASMAQIEGGGGNWRTSIVDLLKLLKLDSSLDARKDLAGELDVHAGEPGSAEWNIALHKAVMRKLAENGGQVPDSFYR